MPAAGAPALTRQQLNRALLARQMLLARETLSPIAVAERLVGLQAQLARPPFTGVWSRVADFDRSALIDALITRRLVRVTAMRGTLHVMSARDYVAFRGAFTPCFEKGLASLLGAGFKTLDRPALDKAGRAFFAKTPAPFEALRDSLAPRFPGANIRGLAYTIRMSVPLVQVPSADDAWGFPAAADFALADTWLKKAVPTDNPRPHALIRRYLAAFGPASVADAQAWSGIPGLAPAFEELRPSLITFRDERKRELFDLPDAPRPDGDTPAPVRLVADFDNLVLGHQDRSRIVADEHRARIATKNLQIAATFLVDGFVAGIWKLERKKAAATLAFTPFGAIDRKTRTALEAEAHALLRFAEPEVKTREIRFG